MRRENVLCKKERKRKGLTRYETTAKWKKQKQEIRKKNKRIRPVKSKLTRRKS